MAGKPDVKLRTLETANPRTHQSLRNPYGASINMNRARTEPTYLNNQYSGVSVEWTECSTNPSECRS